MSGRIAFALTRPLLRVLQEARDAGVALDEELLATVRAIELAGEAYTAAEVAAATAGVGSPPGVSGSRPGVEARKSSAASVDLLAVGPPVRHDPAVMTTTAAAARLGCQPRNVRDLAARRVLPGRRLDSGQWVFDAAEVDAFAAQRSRKRPHRGHDDQGRLATAAGGE